MNRDLKRKTMSIQNKTEGLYSKPIFRRLVGLFAAGFAFYAYSNDERVVAALLGLAVIAILLLDFHSVWVSKNPLRDPNIAEAVRDQRGAEGEAALSPSQVLVIVEYVKIRARHKSVKSIVPLLVFGCLAARLMFPFMGLQNEATDPTAKEVTKFLVTISGMAVFALGYWTWVYTLALKRLREAGLARLLACIDTLTPQILKSWLEEQTDQ